MWKVLNSGWTKVPCCGELYALDPSGGCTILGSEIPRCCCHWSCLPLSWRAKVHVRFLQKAAMHFLQGGFREKKSVAQSTLAATNFLRKIAIFHIGSSMEPFYLLSFWRLLRALIPFEHGNLYSLDVIYSWRNGHILHEIAMITNVNSRSNKSVSTPWKRSWKQKWFN